MADGETIQGENVGGAAPAPVDPAPAPVVDPSPAVAAEPSPAPAAEAPQAAAPASPETPALEPSLLEKFDTENKGATATGDAPKPAEGDAPKPDVAPKPDEPAPLPKVDYGYELPEAIKMDDARKGEFHSVLDEFRRDPTKGAQGLVDLHNKAMSEFADFQRREQYRVFNETRQEWNRQVLADPDIGGSGHQTAMRAVARMRDLFVPESERPAFEEFMRVTGAGDHPAFLRMLHRAARFYDEPPLPPPNPAPPPTNGQPPKRGMRSIYDNSRS